MNMQAVDRAVTGAFKVDVSRGRRIGEVSRQWFSRPDDQKYLSLPELATAVESRSRWATQRVIDVDAVRVHENADDPEALLLSFDRNYGTGARDIEPVTLAPTHWSFGQLASLAEVPGAYLRDLGAMGASKLAAINLQFGLQMRRSENVKLFYAENELMAATGPEYGRVYDWEVVRAVQKIVGNGVSDGRWKVPGMLDWATGTYNPFVDVTKDSTTLYASDRDVFMFLVDDTHPIEVGKLPNGDPDLVFRGFYVWNSEVGKTALGLSTFLLRGVCCNRNIWGAQDVNSISVRHNKNAPTKFVTDMQPKLVEYADSSDRLVVQGINAAKKAVVATSDEDRMEFLGRRKFTETLARRVIQTCEDEEGKKPESVWDFVQGISAVARNIRHQDARIDLEKQAGAMLAKAAARAA